MEFTKENVIRLLTDVRDTIFNLSKENRKKYEEFAQYSGMCDWYEGRATALESTASYIDDTIEWINKFMLETRDYIDKENK